jgi:hypothetical protein
MLLRKPTPLGQCTTTICSHTRMKSMTTGLDFTPQDHRQRSKTSMDQQTYMRQTYSLLRVCLIQRLVTRKSL